MWDDYPFNSAIVPTIRSDFIPILPQNACLLGASLSNGRALDQALEARSSLCATRLMHTLRCDPCHGHPQLQNFDDLLRDGIGSVTSSSLTDKQWIQASLPIRNEGLGIRRDTSLALSAGLTSAASTSNFQNALLAACGDAPDTHVASARLVWSSVNGIPCPRDGNEKNQRAWDSIIVMRDFHLVAEQATTYIDKARLLAVQSRHSSDWLHALPIFVWPPPR